MSSFFIFSHFKSFGRFIIVFLLSYLPFIEASAIPASNEVFLAPQPDGSTLCVRLWGDEFFHYTTTADGIVIIENPDDGFYYYAGLDAAEGAVPSKVRAVDIDRRSQANEQYVKQLDKFRGGGNPCAVRPLGT